MPQNLVLPTYSAIYAFGDSLSDSGNLSNLTGAIDATEPVSPPYYSEQYGSSSGNVFSNGPTWVQNLAVALGLGTLKPSLIGGTNYAYGGAETGLTPQNSNLGDAYLQIISLPSQLQQFEANVPSPSAGALYTLSIGSNDILDILSDTGLSASQQTADVNDAVANEMSFIKALVRGGAANLLVLDVPDLGKTPDVQTGAANGSNTPSASFDSVATQLSNTYNAVLSGQLAMVASATGIHVNIVDAFQLIDDAVANPAAYGLTNVTSPVWTGNFTSDTSGGLTSTNVAVQDQSLFFDSLHPTETGHQAVTALAETQLSGNATNPGVAIQNTTTNQALAPSVVSYVGPVSGLQEQYINITPDNLNISVGSPGWFIHSGAGTDAIAVSGGINVVDGGTGSNFLTSGSGTDTFFVDDRNATTAIWSTVNNFHAGDAATVYGVTPGQFNLTWADEQGAAGFTGLTLHASAAGQPTASVTLTGYATPALNDGQLSVTFGTDPASGSAYMSIIARA